MGQTEITPRQKRAWNGCLVTIAVVVFALMWAAYTPDQPMLPGIEEFVDSHPELDIGDPYEIETIADWAEGKRQWLRTLASDYLFYTRNDSVVTVIESIGGERVEIFRLQPSPETDDPMKIEDTGLLDAN